MSKKVEFEHGGARANAGRKAQFSEPTKVIRVPESQVDFIKNWLLKNFKNGQLSDLSSSINIQTIQPKNDKVSDSACDRTSRCWRAIFCSR